MQIYHVVGRVGKVSERTILINGVEYQCKFFVVSCYSQNPLAQVFMIATFVPCLSLKFELKENQLVELTGELFYRHKVYYFAKHIRLMDTTELLKEERRENG